MPCILWIFMGDKKRWINRWFQYVSSSADSTSTLDRDFYSLANGQGLGCIPCDQTQPFLSDCCEKISHSYPIHNPFISHSYPITVISHEYPIRDRSTPLNHHVSPPKNRGRGRSEPKVSGILLQFYGGEVTFVWFLAALCWDPLVNNCYIMVIIMVI